MRPVSAQFLDAVRGSHQLVTRVTLLTSFQTGVTPVGTTLLVVDGDVTLDSSADVRGTVAVTVDGNDAFTRVPTGALTPYGNELFVERGVQYGVGNREFVSQGYYRIYEVEQSGEPDSPIRLTGRDRMSGIIDARLLGPVQFVAGTSISSIFSTLVGEVYPTATITYDFNAAATTISRSQIADEDRYGFLLDLVRSRGKVMFWNYAGVLRVQDAPDATDVVFDVDAGAHGVLISLDRTLNRDGVYNAVVAVGQAPDEVTPVRAVALDMNPNSPTFWNGRFGKVPRYYFSTFLTNTGQASTAAQKILERSIGLPYNVNFTMVPNPALEPLDPIRVVHEDGYENHIIQQLVIPLIADRPMTGQTREQTDVIIDTEV